MAEENKTPEKEMPAAGPEGKTTKEDVSGEKAAEAQEGGAGEWEEEAPRDATAEKNAQAMESAAERKTGEAPRPESVPKPREIVAPEALPAVGEVAGPGPLAEKGQPVLPEEGGVPLLTEPLSIQWAEEAIAEGARQKEAAKGAQPATGEVKKEPAAPARRETNARAPAGKAPAAPAGVEAGVPEAPAGPLWPYFEPLPAQYRGTLADVRRFIWAGEIFLLAGGILFILLGLSAFAAALGDSRHPWSAPDAAADALWGLLALVLSAGALLCLLLSRRKLRGAYARNDFSALHRRLVPACAAGLVLGLFAGGAFYFLAYVKVDELPVVRERMAKSGEQADDSRQ